MLSCLMKFGMMANIIKSLKQKNSFWKRRNCGREVDSRMNIWLDLNSISVT